MGSNHSARRKSVIQCTPVAGSGVSGYDYSRTTSIPIRSTSKRFAKRAKVRRSISDKFVVLSNSAVVRNEWELAASRRAVSTASDVGHEFVIDRDKISNCTKEPANDNATAQPYHPCSLLNWKMIDEEGNDNSLEKLLELNAVIDHGAAEIIGASKRSLSNLQFAPLDLRCSSASTAIKAKPPISSHTINQFFVSRTMSASFSEPAQQHWDKNNSYCNHNDVPVMNLETSICPVQSRSLKLPEVDACSCKLRYQQPSKLFSESNLFATNKESSINSAASRDSGRASSDEASAMNHTPPDKDRCGDLCLSLCSLASDDLMLETEDGNFTNAPHEGNHSIRTEISTPSIDRLTSIAQCCHTLSLDDTVDSLKLKSIGDIEQKQDFSRTELYQFINVVEECSPSVVNEFATSQCIVSSGKSPVQSGQFAGQPVAKSESSMSVLHSPIPNERTLFEIDTTTYHGIVEDVTQFRTTLLKLQELLQNEESELQARASLNECPEFEKGDLPIDASDANGLHHDISKPTTSTSNSLFVENNTSRLLKENAELKSQVAHLQQITEQQKATILLLRKQHMIKFESVVMSSAADSAGDQ